MKSFIIITFMLFTVAVYGQESTDKNKPVEATIHVDGNCNMCKKRIESAVDVKGVRKAEWNSGTKNLVVVYLPATISPDKIKQLVAEAGHDAGEIKAGDEAYNALHTCCKYRD